MDDGGARVKDSRGSRESRASLLAEVTALMGSGLEQTHLLFRLAHLIIPALGDLCAIDFFHEPDVIVRMAYAHVDADKEPLVNEVRAAHGFNVDSPHGVPAARRTHRSIVIPRVTRSHLEAEARGGEQLALLRRIGPKSWMVIPMLGRREVLGAMTLAVTESPRRYGRADLGLAELVAGQLVVALESARVQREMERARAAAEAASRAKDELLSRLSHELRNPLNAVAGWARLLEGGQLGAEQARRAVQVILRNTAAQTRLLDDLYDLAVAESGKIELVRQPVDLRQLVAAALDDVRPVVEAKDIRLHDALAPLEAPVSGDPGRLQQVLGNLLGNAVKFTPRGGAIEVTLRQEGSRAEIVISDTGEGIAADRLPHVFDRLVPGEGTGRSPSRGLGVGLALVRHLVELHGGSVFAESGGPGRGSTFVVELSLGGDSAPGRSMLLERTAPAAPATLQGVRVLLVDDDPSTIHPVAEALAHAGGDVRGCESAGAALALLAAWRPDVIVSDIEMPGDDGYTFVRTVRALAPEQGGRTPVIALTALNRTEDRIRSLSAGFSMHVSKPVDPAKLTAIVASLARFTG
jgi:signal transduction histidine kinase/ActR/RegA family two-component response regulator